MGKVATYPLPPRGVPTISDRGAESRGPTSGPRGYITPAAWAVPTALGQGAESDMAQN